MIPRYAFNLVSLNEGYSIEEVLNFKGVVYMLVPSKPLKGGIIMADIGFTAPSLIHRLNSHLVPFYGESNKADARILADIGDTLYIKAIKWNITERINGLRQESLHTAQFAYDTLEPSLRAVANSLPDLVHLASGKTLYNANMGQMFGGKRFIFNRDYWDIVEGHKYTILSELIADLKRVGAFFNDYPMVG